MARRKTTEERSVRPRKRRSSSPLPPPETPPPEAAAEDSAPSSHPIENLLPTVGEAERQLLAEPRAGRLSFLRGIACLWSTAQEKFCRTTSVQSAQSLDRMLPAGIAWRTRLPHPAALLVGLGAGWQWCGLRTLIASDLDPSLTTASMVAVVALIAAAIGPRIPARFVVSLARLLRNRRERGEADGVDEGGSIWLLRVVRDRDETLLWLSLAVLSSLAGLMGVLTLPLVSLFGELHDRLLANFFWTRMTLSAFEWTALAILTGSMWLMNGLLVAALSPVIGARTGSRREQPGIAGGVLLGLGAALLLNDTLADRGLSGSQVMLLGSLPLFGLSVLAVTMSHQAESRSPLNPSTESSAPELTGRAEGWIWVSLAAWAAGAALSASGWLDCESLSASRLAESGFGLSGYLLTMGFGVAIASLTVRGESGRTLDCGTVLWGAGVAAGAAAVMTAFLPWRPTFSLLQLLVFALPLGYALHHVERAWLARAGSETLGFAQMTTALLAGAAIGLTVSRWWIAPALGPLGTLTTGGLVLMAFGGLSQIHEEDNTSGVQRRRLGLVFASLACAIALFPASTERWSRRAQALPPPGPPVVAAFLTEADLNRPGRLCIIGVPPETTIAGLDRFAGKIDWVVPDSDWAIRSSAIRPHGRMLGLHDFRMLRTERSRYDLIYQAVGSGRRDSRFAEYSGEWFSAICSRVSVGGRLLVDVPLSGHNIASIQIIVATLTQAAHVTPLWGVVDCAGSHVLRLLIKPETSDPPEGVPPVAWRCAECLIDPAAPLPPQHTLRRDRLTSAVEAADSTDLLEWLETCLRTCPH